MAEAKTTTHFVRLVKGFGAASHRRAGIELARGPVPVEVELTKEQKQALESDAAFEFVDSKDAKATIKEHQTTAKQEGSTDEQQNPDNVSGERPTDTTIASDPNAGVPDAFPGADESGLIPTPKADVSTEDAGSEEEQLSSLTNAQLRQIAADENIEVGKSDNKDTLVEKITAGRANTNDEGQSGDQSAQNSADEGDETAPAGELPEDQANQSDQDTSDKE